MIQGGFKEEQDSTDSGSIMINFYSDKIQGNCQMKNDLFCLVDNWCSRKGIEYANPRDMIQQYFCKTKQKLITQQMPKLVSKKRINGLQLKLKQNNLLIRRKLT